MRIIFLLLALFLSGCSTKLYLQIYNNSSLPLTIYAESEVTISPGAKEKVSFFTSTKYVLVGWSGKQYKYSIDVSLIPGSYMVPGWVHSLNLQVESDLKAYIRKPNFDEKKINDLPESQPIGFPIVAELVSEKPH